MAMGRPPKPTHLKAVTGNPGKRALPKNEPKPKRKTPRKPATLEGIASEYWDRLRENLIDLGILAGVDEDAMEQMAHLYADIRRLQDDVDENGYTYESVTNEGGRMIKANPAGAQLRAAQALFKGLLTEFGMTPSSRSRVKGDGDNDDDKDDPAERHFG